MQQLLAQTTINLNNPGSGFGNLTGLTIGGFVTFAVTFVLIVAGLIFFFMLIIGGLRWILSGGDKAHTEAARNQITAALIGLVIVFAAWAIAQLLTSIFGVGILNFTIPSING
jgi:cbb3-type cytochrome oxidase subunit 3